MLLALQVGVDWVCTRGAQQHEAVLLLPQLGFCPRRQV